MRTRALALAVLTLAAAPGCDEGAPPSWSPGINACDGHAACEADYRQWRAADEAHTHTQRMAERCLEADDPGVSCAGLVAEAERWRTALEAWGTGTHTYDEGQAA